MPQLEALEWLVLPFPHQGAGHATVWSFPRWTATGTCHSGECRLPIPSGRADTAHACISTKRGPDGGGACDPTSGLSMTSSSAHLLRARPQGDGTCHSGGFQGTMKLCIPKSVDDDTPVVVRQGEFEWRGTVDHVAEAKGYVPIIECLGRPIEVALHTDPLTKKILEPNETEAKDEDEDEGSDDPQHGQGDPSKPDGEPSPGDGPPTTERTVRFEAPLIPKFSVAAKRRGLLVLEGKVTLDEPDSDCQWLQDIQVSALGGGTYEFRGLPQWFRDKTTRWTLSTRGAAYQCSLSPNGKRWSFSCRA